MEAKADQTKPASTMTHLEVSTERGRGWEDPLLLPDDDEGRVLVGQQDDPAEDEREDQGQQAVAQHTD